MNLRKHFDKTFTDIKNLNYIFVSNPPYPLIVLDNFIPAKLCKKMNSECNTIPKFYWKKFTRRNSYQEECTNLDVSTVAQKFVNEMHSQRCMYWLSMLTGIKDLIPDPYIVGAGYSRSYNKNFLNVHTDFNWNNTLKLHRMLSLILYLNPIWKEEYGGNLIFKDFQNKKIMQNIPPLFNRVVIWRYHKRGFHGFPDPINCPSNISRNTFRLFFYVSNATYDANDLPHRSLYWFDEKTKEPYDINID